MSEERFADLVSRSGEPSLLFFTGDVMSQRAFNGGVLRSFAAFRAGNDKNANKALRTRKLRVESLEARRLLSANACDVDALSRAALETTQCACSAFYVQEDVDVLDVEAAATMSEVLDQLLIEAGQDPENISEEFIFDLASDPESTYTIYLDFNGHTTTGTFWNTRYNDGYDIYTPPYDVDGNELSFSNAELRDMFEIWLRVCEDYKPFGVNVTTIEPTEDQIVRSDPDDCEYGIRAAIGGSAYDWYGSNAGGVSGVGAFGYEADVPAFIFVRQCRTSKYVGETVAHEVGHTLGLHHDGNSRTAYEYGANGWAPIMGSANLTISQWSRGEYLDANNFEDDLAIIAANGFGYRPDDHADDFESATALTLREGIVGEGIIERNTDVDYFSFELDAQIKTLTIGGFDGITNLYPRVALYDANNALIGTYAPDPGPIGKILSTRASVDLTGLAPGQYYVSVAGQGLEIDGTTIFVEYGSLGYYRVEGTNSSALTRLDAPEDLTASATKTEIAVAWTSAPNAERYQVAYQKVGESAWRSTIVDDCSCVLADLEPNASYAIAVTAIGDGASYGNSQAAVVNAKTLPAAPTKLAKPTALTLAVDGASIAATWAPVADATGYIVSYKKSNDASYKTISTKNASYTLAELEPNTTYDVRVKAKGDGVVRLNSDYCAPKSIATKNASVVKLQPPTNLRASVNGTNVALNWNSVADAAAYVVAYRVAGTSDEFVEQTRASNALTLTGLVANTRYEFKVMAKGNEVETEDSAYADVVEFATSAASKLRVPAGLTLSAAGATIDASWKAVDGGVSYLVAYRKAGDASFKTTTVATTNFTLKGLASETTYEVRVKAVGDKTHNANSDYCAVKTIATEIVPVKLAKATIASVEASETSLTVSWNKLANASSYLFAYRVAGSGSSFTTKTVSSTSYALTGLDPNKTYEVRVKGKGDGVRYLNGDYSVTKTVALTASANALLSELFADFDDLNFDA